jgi:cell division septation protein DedD
MDEKKQADRRAAAERAAAEKMVEQVAAKKKAREEAKAKSSEPERYWVQIASGAFKPDLDKELAKQKSRYGKQLAGKSAWTTPYKSTNRLLVGPFASKSAAQDYVNDARKGGLSSFPVTTSPGQKVERLD